MQVTDDHSLVGEMLREGHLTREAAQNHPQRSILSRALGTEPSVEIDSGELELRAGDTVLLCSDGLYSMISEATMAAILAAVDDPGRIARQLVREAKNEGGHDNITVVVLRLDEVVAPASETAGAEAATAALPTLDEAATGMLPAVGQPVAEAATAALPVVDEPVADAPPEVREPPDGAPPAVGQPPDDAPPDPADDTTAAAPGTAGEAADVPLPADEPVTGAAPRRRRRRLWFVVAVSVLVLVCLVGGAVGNTVYFVGDHDGMVSVYHGLPLQVGGLRLNSLYLQTTTPLATVAPSVLARIERHDLHRKQAALALERQAQGVP